MLALGAAGSPLPQPRVGVQCSLGAWVPDPALPFPVLCLVFVSFCLAPDGLSPGREFFILPTPPSPST